MRVLIFPTNLSEAFLILRRTQWNIIINLRLLRLMYPLFLLHLTGLEFSRRIFAKIFKYQCSRKSIQWKPSCSVRTDGQTETQTEWQTHRRTDREGDVVHVTVAFSNFVNAPRNGQRGQKHAACLQKYKIYRHVRRWFDRLFFWLLKTQRGVRWDMPVALIRTQVVKTSYVETSLSNIINKKVRLTAFHWYLWHKGVTPIK